MVLSQFGKDQRRPVYGDTCVNSANVQSQFVCVRFLSEDFSNIFPLYQNVSKSFLRVLSSAKFSLENMFEKNFTKKKQQRSKNRIKISNVLNIQSNNTKLVTRTYKLTYKKMSRKKIYKK